MSFQQTAGLRSYIRWNCLRRYWTSGKNNSSTMRSSSQSSSSGAPFTAWLTRKKKRHSSPGLAEWSSMRCLLRKNFKIWDGTEVKPMTLVSLTAIIVWMETEKSNWISPAMTSFQLMKMWSSMTSAFMHTRIRMKIVFHVY